MLETFAASVHFKVLLHQHQYMPLMKKYCSFLNIASRDKSRDPFASALLEPDTSQPSASGVSGEPLSHQALAVLASYNAEHSPNQPLPSYISYSEHSIGKVTFTTYVSSTCNCNITFISNNIPQVGIICFIAMVEQSLQDIFFIAEQYAPLPSDSVWNPFTSYDNYGANLWSEKLEDIWEVVPI